MNSSLEGGLLCLAAATQDATVLTVKVNSWPQHQPTYGRGRSRCNTWPPTQGHYVLYMQRKTNVLQMLFVTTSHVAEPRCTMAIVDHKNPIRDRANAHMVSWRPTQSLQGLTAHCHPLQLQQQQQQQLSLVLGRQSICGDFDIEFSLKMFG